MSAGACKYVRVAFNRLFRAIFFFFFSVSCSLCFYFCAGQFDVESSGHIGNETPDEVIPAA